MGIRIHKDIGYFLPDVSCSQILVSDYSDVINDQYTVSKTFIEDLIFSLEGLKEKYPKLSITYPIIMLKTLLSSSERVCTNSFIRTIFHGDTDEGVLFTTPDLVKYSRHDDLLDYYESKQQCEFKVQFLRQPIYPDLSYICVKTPDVCVGKDISCLPGDTYLINDMRILMAKHKVKFDYEHPNIWTYPDEGPKYFHPSVDVITYACAKELGILKADITYLDFIQMLEPAIVTYWG